MNRRRDLDREIAKRDPDHRISELETENRQLRKQRDRLIRDRVWGELREHIKMIRALRHL